MPSLRHSDTSSNHAEVTCFRCFCDGLLCRSEVLTALTVPLEYHETHPTGERVGGVRHERAHVSNLREENAIDLLKDALAEKDGELTALKTALDKKDRELEELRAQLSELRRDPTPGPLTLEEEDIVTQVRDKLKAIRDSGADKKLEEMHELLVHHNSCGSRNVSELQDELPSRTPTMVRTVRRYRTRSTCRITAAPI